jgi:hypothetical protein
LVQAQNVRAGELIGVGEIVSIGRLAFGDGEGEVAQLLWRDDVDIGRGSAALQISKGDVNEDGSRVYRTEEAAVGQGYTDRSNQEEGRGLGV